MKKTKKLTKRKLKMDDSNQCIGREKTVKTKKRDQLNHVGEAFWNALFDSEDERDQLALERHKRRETKRHQKSDWAEEKEQDAGHKVVKDRTKELELIKNFENSSSPDDVRTTETTKEKFKKKVERKPDLGFSSLKVDTPLSKPKYQDTKVMEKKSLKRIKERTYPPSYTEKSNTHCVNLPSKDKEIKNQLEDEQRSKEFNSIIRDIHKFVIPHLGKFERQKMEEDRLRALGCKATKQRKMPLPELRLRREAAQRSIEKQIQLEKQLGVRMFHGRTTRYQAVKEKRERQKVKAVRQDFGKSLGMGHAGYEKNGILKLKKELRKKYV